MSRVEALEPMDPAIPDRESPIDRLEHAVERAEHALAARDAERERLRKVRVAAEGARAELDALLARTEG